MSAFTSPPSSSHHPKHHHHHHHPRSPPGPASSFLEAWPTGAEVRHLRSDIAAKNKITARTDEDTLLLCTSHPHPHPHPHAHSQHSHPESTSASASYPLPPPHPRPSSPPTTCSSSLMAHQVVPQTLPPNLPLPGSGPGTGSGFVSGIEAAAASALTLANNIAFRPTTTQPSKCSKLKIRIYFDSTIFQAGGNLFGRMEITATSSRSLKLGEIAVELAAYEEITSRDFTATQSFLSSRLCFQGPKIPPSNAVHGPCDENGFWTAKKGKTTFPFAFQLPLDCPSSLVFSQTASLRYVVTGLVQIFYHGKDETVLKTKEAFVVEAWDGYNPDYRLPVQASNSTKLFWGGGGPLVLEAMLSERLHSAGGNLTVEVKVKNYTSRKVQGIRLGVSRRLEMVSDKAKAEQNPGLKIDTTSISEVIGTQEFKTSNYLFDTGEERSMTINMIVPGNARTIRGTALFEVTCFVVVSMLLGAFSGELSVEIPVKICHPASLTPAPKPKLDQNLLPHQYNLIDEDIDLEPEPLTENDNRIGMNALPITSGFDQGQNRQAFKGRDLPWGSEAADESSNLGRQGEWSQNDPQLSPANSITSIKSILFGSSPKQRLGKLADKIQRSTSPTSSSHIHHEHRHGFKNTEEQEGRRQMIAKSPALGPAMPIAYVPAVERVRYTPFQPPPTTKAKEFLKAAAQYQQEMAFGGALAGFGGDSTELDLDDKRMASAIHQWISRKESENMRHNTNMIQAPRSPSSRSVSPIQIPIASPGRRRPGVDPIDTRSARSISPQISPTGTSPQNGEQSPYDLLPSPTAQSFSNQTTSRFIHHAHRQPAAPQTEAFGSAPEDCSTTPPLFARPLPCPIPSPPPTGSPHRPGPGNGVHAAQQARPLSPVPIPVQSAEALALAREAYERVKRMGSPVQDLSVGGTASGHRVPRSDHPAPSQPPPEVDLTIKVPVPITAVQPIPSSRPSELSRLLSETAPHPKHGRDGHIIENGPPQPCSSPELRHVPMNRPLPIPKPKPQHLNQRSPPQGGLQSLGSSPPAGTPQVTQTNRFSSSNSNNRNQSGASLQQNAFPVKPTLSNSTSSMLTKGRPPSNSESVSNQMDSSAAGFVYPKAARKPVPGPKPTVAAKPKSLVSPAQLSARQMETLSLQDESLEAALKPTSSMRAPQTLTGAPPQLSSPGREAEVERGHFSSDQRVTRGFQGRSEHTAAQSSRRIDTAQEESSEVPVREAREWMAPASTTVSHPRVAGVDSHGRVIEQPQPARPGHSSPGNHQHQQQPSSRHRNPNHGQASVAAQQEDHIQQVSPNDDEGADQTQSEIRAQAITAANSFRAKGANSGGYIVNTGKLRQVMQDNRSSQNNQSQGGSSSGHLIQALAGGARQAVSSAASSAAGWRQSITVPLTTAIGGARAGADGDNYGSGSSHLPPAPKSRFGQGFSSSPPSHARPTSSQTREGRSHHRNQEPVHQSHDLTMKDIHFQTVSPTYPHQHQQHHHHHHHHSHHPPAAQPIEGARNDHLPRLPRLDKDGQLTLPDDHSSPGSKIMNQPAAVAVIPRSSTTTTTATTTTTTINSSTSSSSTTISAQASEPHPEASLTLPNLDKTLPKIQDRPPRSKVFERPEHPQVDTDSMSPQSQLKPAQRPRHGPGTTFVATATADLNQAGTGGGGAGAGGGANAPKAINPKLQELIQKYNMATSTRP